MSRWKVSVLCVALAAPPALADKAMSDLSGRWQGQTYKVAADMPDCGSGECTITLDIGRCGKGWCGVEVGKDNACGGTALTLAASQAETGREFFEGKLALAEATEPYMIRAYLLPAAADRGQGLEIIGDTGGEFRVFRRSFPFHTNLVRAGTAVCKTDKPVS